MKSLLLGTTFLVAGALCFVSTAKADEPGCMPASTALLRAQAAAEDAGGAAIRLDGDQAEDFLDYLNDDVGRHTEYWGDAVIVGRFPALGYDSVAIVDDGCVDETKLIRLNPATTDLAFRAAHVAFE